MAAPTKNHSNQCQKANKLPIFLTDYRLRRIAHESKCFRPFTRQMQFQLNKSTSNGKKQRNKKSDPLILESPG